MSRHFNWFILALLVGVVLSFGAVIGWAKQFPAGTRRRAASVVFVAPCVAALAANLIHHGPSVFLFYVVIPVSWLLALVLLTMVGRFHQDKPYPNRRSGLKAREVPSAKSSL